MSFRSLNAFRRFDIDFPSAGRFNKKVAFRILTTVGCALWNCQSLQGNIKIFEPTKVSKPTVARNTKVASSYLIKPLRAFRRAKLKRLKDLGEGMKASRRIGSLGVVVVVVVVVVCMCVCVLS